MSCLCYCSASFSNTTYEVEDSIATISTNIKKNEKRLGRQGITKLQLCEYGSIKLNKRQNDGRQKNCLVRPLPDTLNEDDGTVEVVLLDNLSDDSSVVLNRRVPVNHIHPVPRPKPTTESTQSIARDEYNEMMEQRAVDIIEESEPTTHTKISMSRFIRDRCSKLTFCQCKSLSPCSSGKCACAKVGRRCNNRCGCHKLRRRCFNMGIC